VIPNILTYPVRGSPRVDAVIVGGGLHLLAVWLPVLPFVAVAGSLSRVLIATATAGPHANPERPGWQPVGPLLRDGLRATATVVGYLAVPVVLLTVTLGGPLEGVDPTGTTDGIVFIVGSTVSTLLAFALSYPLPAALVAVSRERSLRAAIDTTLVGAATRDAGYLVAVLLAAGGLGLTFAAYETLNAAALGFFIAFYAEVVTAAAVGKATGRAWERRGI
jgi:hypothetical protein